MMCRRRGDAPMTRIATMPALAAIATSALGCHNDARSPCDELNQYAPAGVVLANDNARCAQLLEFAHSTEQRYDMEFSNWLTTVAGQRTAFMNDAVFAMTGLYGWTPAPFSLTPAQVPCGRALPLTDDLWVTTPLSKILKSRPVNLYVSLSVSIPPVPGNVAEIDVQQDFDCDGHIGDMKLVGEFHVGVPAAVGGWKLISSTVPPLDE
jgi:hypothetical protein